MRDLLRISPILYLNFYSDLFLRISEREYRLAALGRDCHSGFLLFVSAALSLPVYLSLLSPLTPLFIPPTLLCLLSYLTYFFASSFFPSSSSLSLALASLSLFVPLAVSISLRRVSSTLDCIVPALVFWSLICCQSLHVATLQHTHTPNQACCHSTLFFMTVTYVKCYTVAENSELEMWVTRGVCRRRVTNTHHFWCWRLPYILSRSWHPGQPHIEIKVI